MAWQISSWQYSRSIIAKSYLAKSLYLIYIFIMACHPLISASALGES
jgi:hypothetical protein